MKKVALICAMVCMVAVSAFAVDITLSIPADKVDNAVACLKWYGIAQFKLTQGEEETDNAFAKRTLRQMVIGLDVRYRAMVASQTAQQSVVIDNELIEE